MSQDFEYDDLPPDLASLEALRIPPHSIEAEQAVLGGLMLSSEAFDKVADLIAEEDFYQYNHRLIFRAVSALFNAVQPTDVVTIKEYLEQRKWLEDAGGIHYIAALSQETPSAANIKAYATIVRERSVLRQLIAVSNEIADAAFEPGERTSRELLDHAEARVFAIADQTARSGGFQRIEKVLAETVAKIQTLYESKSAITGLTTGFKDLDKATSGLQSSDLIIVAGRPSMGKTTFAMNLAENVSMTADGPVAVFSLEMGAWQLGMRMVASLSRVKLKGLLSGQLSEQDWTRIMSVVQMLNGRKNLFIDDTGDLSPTELRAKCRRLKRENGLSMVVVDYLQLMKSSDSRENRTNEISEISRSLKALAKEMDVPVIALSQLNRSLEQRPDKRPVMSDLRESGAIEQDADVIMFVYRDEVYHPENEENKGVAEILIRKQRNGPTGTVRLSFLGEYTKFENYADETWAGSAPPQSSMPSLPSSASDVSTPAPQLQHEPVENFDP